MRFGYKFCYSILKNSMTRLSFAAHGWIHKTTHKWLHETIAINTYDTITKQECTFSRKDIENFNNCIFEM